ncbi:MAG: hypothetical protein S4CHLAM20_03330 [Chlamydiia bacterium]|nr:hypothetical protein [Chlamydiia bacterium]
MDSCSATSGASSATVDLRTSSSTTHERTSKETQSTLEKFAIRNAEFDQNVNETAPYTANQCTYSEQVNLQKPTDRKTKNVFKDCTVQHTLTSETEVKFRGCFFPLAIASIDRRCKLTAPSVDIKKCEIHRDIYAEALKSNKTTVHGNVFSSSAAIENTTVNGDISCVNLSFNRTTARNVTCSNHKLTITDSKIKTLTIEILATSSLTASGHTCYLLSTDKVEYNTDESDWRINGKPFLSVQLIRRSPPHITLVNSSVEKVIFKDLKGKVIIKGRSLPPIIENGEVTGKPGIKKRRKAKGSVKFFTAGATKRKSKSKRKTKGSLKFPPAEAETSKRTALDTAESTSIGLTEK